MGARARRRSRGSAPRAARHLRARRRRRRSGRRTSCSTHTEAASALPGSTSRRGCAGSSTSRTSSAPWRPGCCSTSTRTRSPRASRAWTAFPGRFEAIDEGQPFAVVVDYAHTPDSLATVLCAARGLGPGRVIVVFGAGGDRDRGKRPLMGKVAADLADVTIVTSDNPRSEEPLAIIQDVLQGTGMDVEIDPDRRSAIARAVSIARGRRRGRDRGQGARAGSGRRRRRHAVRRPRGRAGRTAERVVIPLAGTRSRPSSSAGSTASGEITAIKADSRDVGPGDLFVALNPGVRVRRRTRAHAGRRRSSRRSGSGARGARLARALEERRAGRRGGRLRGEDDDEGHPRRALRAARADDLGGEEPEQRDRPAAHGLPPRAGDARCWSPRWGCAASARSRALCVIARPSIAVVPHIGPEHLELLGSSSGWRRRTPRRSRRFPPGGTAVVPAHAEALEPFLTRDDVTFRRFSPSEVDTTERRDALRDRRRARSSSSSRSRSVISR